MTDRPPMPLSMLFPNLNLDFLAPSEGFLERLGLLSVSLAPLTTTGRELRTNSFLSAPPTVSGTDEDWPEAPESDSSTLIESKEIEMPTGLDLILRVAVLDEIVFSLPAISGIQFAISANGSPLEAMLSIREQSISLKVSTAFAIRFSPSLLKPMRQISGTGDQPAYEIDTTKEYAEIRVAEAGIIVDSEGRISFESEVGVDFQDNAMMIGNTGIILKNLHAVMNLGGSGPRPMGAELDWKGLYISQGSLIIPNLFSGSINITGLGIGSGGISGTIGAAFTVNYDPVAGTFSGGPEGKLLGMAGGIQAVDIAFKQNIPTTSNIKAKVLLPFFDKTNKPLDLNIGLSVDGKFGIAVDDPELILIKPDIFRIQIRSVGFSFDNGVLNILLSGKIKPLLAGLDWPEFDVKSLTIDSSGNVSIEGGWIDLPVQKGFDLYGFSANITKIGFGNEEDGMKWIGLSGSIKLVDGLPLEGSVEGLRIKWKPPPATDIEMEMGGVKVAFEIKDLLKFNGSVIFIDEPTKKGFKGGVKMVLYPLNGSSLDVQLLVAKNTSIPPYTFFYTYIDADLPVGIPLFSTGLALYGMGGLFGYNIEPSKGKAGKSLDGRQINPNETWYENPDGTKGWYLRDVPGVTDASTKWLDKFESMAFGAGITLGTLPDNGFKFSAKTLIVLLLPGPVILVEGAANFLKERKKLDEKPPFRLLAVYDDRAGTFLMNIEANYESPQDTGKVIKIRALAEAFFDFNNSQNWHLYIGQDQPEAKRIRAKILKLFEANAYFMLTSRDLAMGAWVGYDNWWKFGPMRVELSAWMEGRAKITFKPAQAEGQLTLQGNVQLKAFGTSVGLSVAAGMQVQTPNPFLVHAEFRVKLNLPWPLPDPKAHVVLEWKEEIKPPIPVPLAKFGVEHLKVTEKWTLDRYPEYDSNKDGFFDGSQVPEQAGAIQNSPVIPLDARPVIVFAKPVEDAAKIGDNPTSTPLPENVGEGYQYSYRLLKVILEKRPRNQNRREWTVVAVKSYKGGNENVGELYGKWQAVPENGQQQQQVNTKLMLWTNSAFEISRELNNNDIFTGPIIDSYNPCNLDTGPAQTCVDFEEQKEDTVLSEILIHEDVTLYNQPGKLHVVIYNAALFGTTKALLLEGSPQRLYIVFSKPVAKVDLSLGKETSVSIYAFEEDSKGLEPEQSSSSYDYYFSDPNQVSIEGKGITALLITGKGLLAKICYVTAEEMKRVNDNAALQTHIRESTELHWSQHKDILFEPNMYYKLTAVSEVVRNKEQFQFIQHSYFQTGGAPGVYSSSSGSGGDGGLAVADRFPTGGPLKDLAAYVKNTIPRIGQRPVYRAYDIGVTFNESYVDQMYLMGDTSLSIELYDNNDERLLDTDGTPISIQNHWGDNPQIFLTREEEQWIHLLNMNECAFLDYHHKPKTKNLYAGHKRLSLKPETLYKAKIVAISSDNINKYIVYQFSFITSKYASFTHQIQSFHDVLWSHGRLLGSNAPLPLLTAAKKTILEGILSSLSTGNSYQPDIEGIKFQQISELFGLGVRQLPASFEMLALDDNPVLVGANSRCYGFLMESPEPIDWNRTVLTAKYKSATTGIPSAQESTEAIKILGASIVPPSGEGRPGTNYNNEWVDILLREDFDISDFSIEHMSAGSNNSKKFMTFRKESKSFPAGTIIRVHSGRKQDDDDNSNNPSADIEHRYAELDSWQFSPAGETIKVLDKKGSVFHSKYIVPQGSYSSKDIILIRNADNTRAFIFFPYAGEKAGKIDNGNYLLDFKYKLNIGNNWPILKRMGGIDSDEVTSLEFWYPAILP